MSELSYYQNLPESSSPRDAAGKGKATNTAITADPRMVRSGSLIGSDTGSMIGSDSGSDSSNFVRLGSETGGGSSSGLLCESQSTQTITSSAKGEEIEASKKD